MNSFCATSTNKLPVEKKKKKKKKKKNANPLLKMRTTTLRTSPCKANIASCSFGGSKKRCSTSRRISREAIFVSKTVTNDGEKKGKEEKKYEEDEKKGWKMKTTSSALAMVVATSLAVADCSVLDQPAEAMMEKNEITQVAGRGGRSYRAAPRGGARYRRGAPPPRAAYGPTVMPVPVPMFSPFGFGMPFGFGYGMPFGFFGGGGFIFQLFLLAFVVNVVTGFFNSAEQSRYDEYERDEWEREQNQSIDDDDFSDDWRKRR